MKTIFKATAAARLAAAILALSCLIYADGQAKKSAGAPETKTSVHILGSYEKDGQDISFYWKDGVRTDFGEGETATAITISGNTVYIAGYYEIADTANFFAGSRVKRACYWKDGVRVDLHQGKGESEAHAITVSGNTVYVAGRHIETSPAFNKSIACYWKDGKRTLLYQGTGNSGASGIAVLENTVYTAGHYFTDRGLQTPGLWRNSARTNLFTGIEREHEYDATAIAISGNTAYISGYVNSSVICYWTYEAKAGHRIIDISPGDPNDYRGQAHAIAVSGNTVYTAGHYYDSKNDYRHVACYWEGRTKKALELPERAPYSHAGAIAVAGGAVYAAGSYKDISGRETACYWKDGKKTDLSAPVRATKYSARAIAVTGGGDLIASAPKNNEEVKEQSPGANTSTGREEVDISQLLLSTTGRALVGRVRGKNPVMTGGAFVLASKYNTFTVKTDGTLWAWGDSDNGQIGEGKPEHGQTGFASLRCTPVRVGTANNWASVANSHLDGESTFAIRTDGTLWAWGKNRHGQLGEGKKAEKYYVPVQIGTDANWASVSAGESHTAAIKTDGTLWAWGNNWHSQLGEGKKTDEGRNTPIQTGTDNNWASVYAGSYYTVAIKTDGTLWGWGKWEIMDSNRRTRGIFNNTVPVQIGTAKNWASVSVGLQHIAAIRTDGTLWTWGDNAFGQLGTGSRRDYKTAFVQVGTAKNWASVSVGSTHTLAIRKDGTLWAWGNNEIAQLGDLTTTTRLSPVQIGAAQSWASVSAGDHHSAAITTGGTVYTWGDNGNCQIGDGTRQD